MKDIAPFPKLQTRPPDPPRIDTRQALERVDGLILRLSRIWAQFFALKSLDGGRMEHLKADDLSAFLQHFGETGEALTDELFDIVEDLQRDLTPIGQ